MKLTTTTQVSVDGVMQGRGGPDENTPALDLVASRPFPRGITLQVHRPAGRPRYATATAD